jgi:hypothetical protein
MTRTLLIATLTVALNGCFAQRITFRPNEIEQKQLVEAPLPYTVNVVHWAPRRPGGFNLNANAYASSLFNQLRKSGSFSALTYDSTRRQPADLTVESTGAYCNTASIIPLFTILTLGIVPTVWHEKDCVGMVFRRNGAPMGSDSVVVSAVSEGTAVMGWVALPLMLWPGWAFLGEAGEHQKIRLAILTKRQELARLLR